MRVTIFGGLIESVSMDQYADGLAAGLRKYGAGVEVREVRPSLERLRRWVPGGRLSLGAAKYLYRYIWYPLWARGLQAHVNHITDHAHAHLVAWLDEGRTVVTCHDLVSFVHPENMKATALFPSLGQRALRYSVGHLHRAARVVADSQNTKEDLLKFTKCVPERIRVIYPGLNELFYEGPHLRRPEGFRRQNNLDSAMLLLHVGHNGPYKNIETMLAVVASLRGELQLPVRLVKVGSDFTDSQKRLIAQLGLGDMIAHLGQAPLGTLAQAYRACDLLLFPSLYEGFGWPPLEAMACGLPVVTSKAGAIPEVVGEAAIMVEPWDQAAMVQAVASVLTNEDLRRNLIAKGKRQAEKFTWGKAIAELVELYREVYQERNKVDPTRH